MFKKISGMENEMRTVLRTIIESDNCHSVINSLKIDSLNALHECLLRGYIVNINEARDANGCYHFASLGNTHISAEGLRFIQSTSIGFRIKNAIFDILKGTLGFWLGILSTVIAQYIISILIST